MGRALADASAVLGAAKVIKTPNEIECTRRAVQINEAAIAAVAPTVKPGVRGTDVTGHFLRAIFDLGASSNSVDPIWQVMPPSIAEGPYTSTGDVIWRTSLGKDNGFGGCQFTDMTEIAVYGRPS